MHHCPVLFNPKRLIQEISRAHVPNQHVKTQFTLCSKFQYRPKCGISVALPVAGSDPGPLDFRHDGAGIAARPTKALLDFMIVVQSRRHTGDGAEIATVPVGLVCESDVSGFLVEVEDAHVNMFSGATGAAYAGRRRR